MPVENYEFKMSLIVTLFFRGVCLIIAVLELTLMAFRKLRYFQS